MSGAPPVQVFTQADLDNLRGTLQREADQLGQVIANCVRVDAPDYEPLQADWRKWRDDWAAWSNSSELVGTLYLQGEALLTRAQGLEKRLAALGCMTPFPVQPPKPSFQNLFDFSGAGPLVVIAVLLLLASQGSNR